MADCCCYPGLCSTSLSTVNANPALCASCKSTSASGLQNSLGALAQFGSVITGIITKTTQAPAIRSAALQAQQQQLQAKTNQSLIIVIGIVAVVVVLLLRK